MSTAKVMIVEDNTTVAKDLHGCLLEFGYEVTSIQVSGEEAIEKARSDNPDIVIMDIHLRDKMNGLEAAELIHEELGIPVVILSAFDDKALLEKAKKVGAFGYLLKPFEERGLFAHIEMTLYKARTEKDTQRLHEEIQRHKEKLCALTVELSVIAEKERKEIAHELHENIAQIIFMALYHVNVSRETECSSDRSSALNQVVDLLHQSIKYTRTLTYQLYPPNLRELGLDSAIAWLLAEREKDYAFVCRFQGGLETKTVHDNIKAFLFRATQELLVNVVKHAQAEHVQLSTWRTKDMVGISIEDDGVGFDSDRLCVEMSSSGGFGLFSMRERLEALGGNQSIDAQIGRGTKITIVVPNRNTCPAQKLK